MVAVQATDDVQRVLDDGGSVVAGADAPAIPREDLTRLFEVMLLVRTLDQRMLGLAGAARPGDAPATAASAGAAAQPGPVGFYLPARGEEAAHLAVYPLRDSDWVFPCLREHGAWLWRGYSVADFINQLAGNERDPAKGRQMPAHHTSRAHGMVSVSSPAGTQIPQAAGLAHAAKLAGRDDVAMAFFGAATTAVGEFHVGLNFAGVYRAPVVFVCRNSGRAASGSHGRPSTIARKAMGYGIPAVRVDGSDVLAVIAAAGRAVERARAGHGPTLIEALTRGAAGNGSSDTRAAGDPIHRFRSYLTRQAIWSEAMERGIIERHNAVIDRALRQGQSLGPPPLESLFDDVYEQLPWHLVEQRASLLAHRRRPPDSPEQP